MKFMVTRTSGQQGAPQPCEGAVREKYTRVDERMTNDPTKLPEASGELWYVEGTNHRVERGHIKRDLPAEGWFIEIDSLDGLLALHDEVGDIIVTRHFWNPAYREIEIYDGYRE